MESETDQFFSFSAYYCGTRPIVTNGALVEVTKSYLRYQCVRFFKLVGPDTVFCHSSGSWTPVPVCKGENQPRLLCGSNASAVRVNRSFPVFLRRQLLLLGHVCVS